VRVAGTRNCIITFLVEQAALAVVHAVFFQRTIILPLNTFQRPPRMRSFISFVRTPHAKGLGMSLDIVACDTA
jgi:hypothetical protein